MDIQQLHERTGINKRKLRYCLDHALVPGVSIGKDEVGQPRKFHDDVGFGIVCAAKLLELGLRHETIQLFLRGMLEARFETPPNQSILATILTQELAAKAELGDGLNVRVMLDGVKECQWHAPGNPAPLASSYQPLVVVTLDLGGIFRQVLGKTNPGT